MSSTGLILQHGADGPPGRLGDWLRARGIPFEIHHAGLQALPADVDRRPWVASLGSEESATALEPEWIGAEVEALRRAVAADVPVLGLCFGGQALSVALGGGVRPSEPPEVGWVAVRPADGLVPAGPWLQYHYELLDVPPGGVELARSPAGPAAFRHGRHLGLQFHPEVEPALAAEWAAVDRHLPPGVSAEQIAEQGARYGAAAREQAFRLFDAWWELARPAA
jgi:GMP synthase-like glutamine amidotransferase